MWKAIKCYFGKHRWFYADFSRVNDNEYYGPINYVVCCVYCGKRKYWEDA